MENGWMEKLQGDAVFSIRRKQRAVDKICIIPRGISSPAARRNYRVAPRRAGSLCRTGIVPEIMLPEDGRFMDLFRSDYNEPDETSSLIPYPLINTAAINIIPAILQTFLDCARCRF